MKKLFLFIGIFLAPLAAKAMENVVVVNPVRLQVAQSSVTASNPLPVNGTVTVQDGGSSITVDSSSSTAGVSSYLMAHSTGGIDGIYESTSVVATGQLVSNVPSKFHGGWVYNANSTTVRYLKLYNKATAPTVGTDAQAFSVPIPPSSIVPLSGVIGINFSLGIGIGATTGPESSNSTAPSANEVHAVILYKQ